MTIIGADGFRAAASTLGLRLEAPEVSWRRNNSFAMLEGVVDGTHVVVQQGEMSPSMRVYFHAALEPALDLGLGISPRGSYVAQALGLQAAETGPRAFDFDAAFEIKALEPARLSALLTPQLREVLMTWHAARRWAREAETKNSLELWITDESVIVRIQTNMLGFRFASHPLAPEELVRDIRATAALARAVNEAATHVPPSAVLAPHVEAWRAFAAANNLAFVASPLRMSGSFDGVTFAARAAFLSPEEGYGVELTMPFARPLPCYLRLGRRGGWFEPPRSYPDSWSEWASPQKTGDDAFDSVLRVVSADPEAQSAILSPEVRRALLDLAAANEHVHMTTEAISVRTKTKVAPAAFSSILAPLAAIEKLVDRTAAR